MCVCVCEREREVPAILIVPIKTLAKNANGTILALYTKNSTIERNMITLLYIMTHPLTKINYNISIEEIFQLTSISTNH